jgi:hypothetical protein
MRHSRTARRSVRPKLYVIEGAQSWTVGDQLMKKEIMVQGGLGPLARPPD